MAIGLGMCGIGRPGARCVCPRAGCGVTAPARSANSFAYYPLFFCVLSSFYSYAPQVVVFNFALCHLCSFLPHLSLPYPVATLDSILDNPTLLQVSPNYGVGGNPGPLRGYIPWSKMTALEHLQALDIQGNQVTGSPFDSSISKFTGLREM